MMSYQEKRTITNLILGAVVFISYGIYAFSKLQSGAIGPEDLKTWAITMLLFIGGSIILSIIVQILFSVVVAISLTMKNTKIEEKELNKALEATVVEDEMDKLIKLKSSQVGFILAGIGFILSLVSLVLNFPGVTMLHIIFYSFGIGSFCEGIASLYYYRKGIIHG